MAEVRAEDIAEVVVQGQPASPSASSPKKSAIGSSDSRPAARAGRRTGGGRRGGRRGDQTFSRGAFGSRPADRELPVPRTHGRWKDRASPHSGRGALRRRGGDGANRHERVPGAAHRLQARRRASRLRGLRGGRPAHREREAQALLGACSSTRSRRRTRTSSTSCCRSSTMGA